MSSRSVGLHPEARRELRAAAQSYEQEAPNLGRDLVAEVRVVMGRIADWPDSGSPDEHDVRRVVLTRFPFMLVYQVLGNSIEIIAVMHQRRKPGYWRDRV